MSKFGLGWNIDAADLRAFLRDNNNQGLLGHLDKLNPECTLIMDGLGLAVQIKERYPDMVVIHRDFSHSQGDEWQKRSPQEFVNKWVQEGHREIVRYLTNEPSFNGGNVTDYAKHEADTMNLARSKGFTVVALNTGIGRYEKLNVRIGDFDELLIAAMEGGHYLGCHEYYTVSLPASQMPVTSLLKPQDLQKANYSYAPIKTDYTDYDLIFRCAWFVARIKEIGYSDDALKGKFILTEFGYDNIKGGSNPTVDNVITELEQTYGVTKYNGNMRGVATYQKLAAIYWKDMTYLEHIIQEFEWWLDVKPDWILGACLFAFNADWGYPKRDPNARDGNWESGHDYSGDDMRGILPLLEEFSAMYDSDSPTEPIPTEPIPEIEWVMKEGVISSYIPGGSNVRESYNVLAPIAFLIDGAKSGLISTKTIPRDGYEWHKIVINGLVGYIAKTKSVEIVFNDSTPELVDYVRIQRMIDESIALVMSNNQTMIDASIKLMVRKVIDCINED